MASRTTEQQHSHETTEQAWKALLDHYPGCPACTAADDEGRSLNTPCETGDRLYQEYRQAWRTARGKETR
jgi:hypothetical protein